MYSIAIVEDREELREGFEHYVNSHGAFKVIGSYGSCEEALKDIDTKKPDVILMDIDLPGMSGIVGTSKIKKILPRVEIIIITIFENSKTVFDALCNGASGYLTKNTDQRQLIKAIEEVLDGGAPMSSKIAKMVVGSFQRSVESPLTERETEILASLSTGKSYSNIAEDLHISKETVKYHIKNIYIKLQVNSKADAIAVASEKRYI